MKKQIDWKSMNWKDILCWAAIGILVLVSLIILLVYVSRSGSKASVPAPAATSASAPVEPTIVERVKEVLVPTEKEITADIIQDGLQDMGVLITQEYWFTEVMTYSSVQKLFGKLTLGFTESSYVAGYDGVITAGLDFTSVTVDKNETTKTITVTVPKCEIRSIDIDPNSFVLYSERESVTNPISVADYNDSVVELERNAKEKALKRGLLEQADQNAAAIITNFVSGLVDPSEYKIQLKTR